MKRNKKLLMYFLALNTIMSSYLGAATTAPVKYDKMYNSMVKNIEKGNSNEENYKLVEKVLNQRNKELKDLYKQSDYIVKPEYLEWQVFFSGFYDERSRGDNTFESAEYHSDPSYNQQGYYDANGQYVVTDQGQGKPYAKPQEPKEINLGVSIPIKGMTRGALNLAITPAGAINISPATLNVTPPSGVVTPMISTYKFDITTPSIVPPTIMAPISFNVQPPSTGNNDETFLALRTTDIGTSSRGYTAMISQYNLTSGVMRANYIITGNVANPSGGYLSSYEVTNLQGTRDYDIGRGAFYGDTTVLALSNINPLGLTVAAVPGANASQVTALYKITAAEEITLGTMGAVGTNNLTMEIVSNLAVGYGGSMPHLIQYDPHSSWNSRNNYKPYTTDYFGNPISGTAGAGTVNRYGELINYGTIKGRGNSLLLLGLQSHAGNFSPTYKNYGLMLGEYDTTSFGALGGERHVGHAFIALQGGNPSDRRWEFYNMAGGRIEMQAANSIGYYYGQVNPASQNPHYNIFNNGDIVLYGQGNVGIKTAGASDELTTSKIVLNNPIRINGDKSIGIEIAKLMDDGYGSTSNPSGSATTYDLQPAVIKVTIGDEINKYSGNASGTNSVGDPYSSALVEDSTGLYINKSTLFYRLRNFDFQFGANARYSTLVNITNGHLFLDNIDVTDMNITAGQDNFGIIATGANSELTLRPNIKIGFPPLAPPTAVNGTIAIYGTNGAKIHLDSANSIETNGLGSHGIMLSGAGTTLNDVLPVLPLPQIGFNHSFLTTGNESAALYVENGATADLSKSPVINVKSTGDKSIGVYNDGGTVILGTATGSGDYEIGTNGVLFYNHDTGGGSGTIETSGVNFTVGNGSLFTRITTPSTTPGSQQIKFTHTGSNTSLNLLSGGTGFIYTGDGVTPVTSTSLGTYFSNNYTGLNNMNVTVNPGSRLFVIERYASMNLTDIGAISAPSGIFNNVTNLGGGNAFLLRGTLVLNPTLGTIDLDNAADIYNNVERALTGVTVNLGVVINGTLPDQVAISDDNSYDPGSYVKFTNNGTINLTGNTSTGMYANNGIINNNGPINVTGQNGIGIFSENGTLTTNSNVITVGDKGVGIYGISYQNPTGTLPLYGGGLISITNSGTITASTGNNAIGIYADNNKIGGLMGGSQIDLTSGTINLGASENAIGVYVNKGTVTDTTGSTITVGKNGIGIYAKDSALNLTNTVINLFGDNSLGLYLDGTTSLNSTNGTINIAGQNIVLFNMASSGTVNNNFTVGSVAAGSSYSLGNIVNGAFTYGGSTNLGSNGTLVSGQNSAVYLNGASVITVNSGATGVAAIALDGQYGGTVPVGMTAGMDGENSGTITLENNSAGIFGKNGSRLSNLGTITVGNASAGIMTSGAGSSAINNGTITLGKDSQGIYLKDGVNIENNASGVITSSGVGATGTIGMYADNVSAPIENNGIIQLTGNKSIGIYKIGAGVIINNTGTGLIQVGDSDNPDDPSIGIYSDNAGDIVNNTGIVTSGKKSIGIYSAGGTVNQNGTLDIGNMGVGIYSTNGTVNIAPTATFSFGTDGAVGVYGTNSNVTNAADMNVRDKNYGFILTGGTFTNTATNITLGSDSVFLYRSGAGTDTNGPGTTLTMTGSDNIGYYTVNGATVVNNGTIIGTAGKNNVGIYNTGGSITNTGTINIGDSALVYVLDGAGNPTTEVDVANSKYAVGLYGEGSTIVNTLGANINVGAGAIGLTIKGGTGTNEGSIVGIGNNTRGMYAEGGTITNKGTITVTGNDVIGMAGNGNGNGTNVINETGAVITVTGDRAIGIYGNSYTTVTNKGKIIVNGMGTGQGIVLSQGSTLINSSSGTIQIDGATPLQSFWVAAGNTYPTPTIINSGVIKVSEKFETNGVDIVIKVDPKTVTVPTASQISAVGYDPIAAGASYLISNSVHIEAPAFNITAPLQVTGNFAEGTNVKKYKLEDVIKPGSGFGINAGKVPVVSKSLTWRATPVMNAAGNIDFWMEKIDYNDFTDGLWYADFGRALDAKYENAQGDAMKIYDKLDIIENEGDFRHIMAGLAGEVYANINQREADIAKTFENSLDFIENSTNNTKENVKVNIIAGKGKNSEKTDGVTGYDYSTAGVLGLREVERTYRHTFGYSLGYLHTGFEFNDGNESEEWVDTIQLGVHSKYSMNDWKLRNDLTGRVSFHNVDRNIDWTAPNGRSEMNGMFETYSITSDNILGREFALGKNTSITPYGAFRAMYVTRPTFNETGLEALEVEGNDAWSVKPRAGIELKASLPLGPKTAWQLKGIIDLAYEYELADFNEREKARLIAVEDGYHDLSKPEDEKGTFRTRAALGAEVEDRYGIFLTGEYGIGNSDQDDYRAGVTLKAVF